MHKLTKEQLEKLKGIAGRMMDQARVDPGPYCISAPVSAQVSISDIYDLHAIVEEIGAE